MGQVLSPHYKQYILTYTTSFNSYSCFLSGCLTFPVGCWHSKSFLLLVNEMSIHMWRLRLSSTPANDLPVHYLRLLAPPLQLLSAAMWQVVQQGLVDHYGLLEEFVTMVTELVPELMSYSQRAQLILGLRARVSNHHTEGTLHDLVLDTTMEQLYEQHT